MSQASRRNVAALLSGFLFSAGLVVSGMTIPSNVIGFLDVTGDFNPTLAFVMVGAIGVHASTLWLLRKRARPVWAEGFRRPAQRAVDGRLLGGSAVFGIGWGLGGYCPGPSLVALGAGALPAFVFVGAMLLSMALVARFDHPISPNADASPQSLSG